MPITPHRFDESSVQAFRAHEADDDPDASDYARDCEAEEGRENFGAIDGLLSWPMGLYAVAIVAAIAYVVFSN